ncbi:MAG: hypothetical protein AB8C95_06075 [Phycisphaeraceae bacterium]
MKNLPLIKHAFALLLITSILVGCSGYAIEGRVVRGSTASIQIVDKNDLRLTEANPTGGGAVIEGVLEPDTPTERQSLGRVVTDGQGYFAIPVNAMGSGFLEYEAMLVARREGHRGTMRTIDLPRSRQRVLITLPLGQDNLRVPEGFLDQTLREAKPYLEERR